MIRINTIHLTFGLTQEQVRNSGIDIEVLQYLPELELVSVLSDIASNLPQEEAKDNEVSQRLPWQIEEALPHNQESLHEDRNVVEQNEGVSSNNPHVQVQANPTEVNEDHSQISSQQTQSRNVNEPTREND